VAHLGMSGQFRSAAGDRAAFGSHERVRFLLDDGAVVSFVDQRTFGWLLADSAAGDVPDSVAHIARDPFDAAFDPLSAGIRLRSRHSEVKRVLLDQRVVSGIGNIYADETLWRMRLHPRRRADSLSRATATALLRTAGEVMAESLLAGGTSFDPLYVNVNGESGWFARRLAAYGRDGQPCARCGSIIRRERFMNRSSYLCPRCQRAPRGAGQGGQLS
jgi:formamidopyrimidine-DNA glycosylase